MPPRIPLLKRVPADATRVREPERAPVPTIGPQRVGLPNVDRPGVLSMLNEMLNPVAAGQEARRQVERAMFAAKNKQVGKALTSAALAAMSVPGAPDPTDALRWLKVVKAGDEVFVHGTTTANAAALERAGRLDPSAAPARVYGDTDWHRSVAYATRPQGLWVKPTEAGEHQMARYDEMFDVRLPPDANVLQVKTAEDAERLLDILDPPNRQFYRIGDSPNVSLPWKDEVVSRSYVDKMRALGIDAIDIADNPEIGDVLGTAPGQLVIFNPQTTKVSNRRPIAPTGKR